MAHTNLLLVRGEKSPALRDELIENAIHSLNKADQIYNARHYEPHSRPEIEQLRALVAFHQGQLIAAIDKAMQCAGPSIAAAPEAESTWLIRFSLTRDALINGTRPLALLDELR